MSLHLPFLRCVPISPFVQPRSPCLWIAGVEKEHAQIAAQWMTFPSCLVYSPAQHYHRRSSHCLCLLLLLLLQLEEYLGTIMRFAMMSSTLCAVLFLFDLSYPQNRQDLWALSSIFLWLADLHHRLWVGNEPHLTLLTLDMPPASTTTTGWEKRACLR